MRRLFPRLPLVRDGRGFGAAVVAVLGALLIAATPALSATGTLVKRGFEEPVVASGSSQLLSTGSGFPGWSAAGAPGKLAPIGAAFTSRNLSFPAKAGAQRLDLTGTTQSATGVAGSCTAVGTWVHVTPDIGSTTWTIGPGGQAQETGIGNATGTAALSGQVLTITFVASDTVTTGVYSWTLGPDCRSGTGTLMFTGPPPRAGMTHASTVTKTGGPPVAPPVAPPPDPCSATSNARAAQSCPRTVTVKRLSNEVFARPVGDPARVRQLRVGDTVGADEVVFTLLESTVEFELKDRVTFAIGEFSEVSIAELSDADAGGRLEIALRLLRGKLDAELFEKRERVVDTNFEVQTPTATCSQRGTIFSVAYDPTARATLVTTRRGSVDVDPVGRGLASVLVGAGREVEVTPRSITPLSPIGRAGARGGVNRFAALGLVRARVARGMGPCGSTIPRVRTFAVSPAPGGWRVAVMLRGRLRGTSLWTVTGRRVTPVNALARRLQSRCR